MTVICQFLYHEKNEHNFVCGFYDLNKIHHSVGRNVTLISVVEQEQMNANDIISILFIFNLCVLKKFEANLFIYLVS